MPNNDLSNKVAVVTGGADGIGEGIVRTLWGCGAHVVIADVQDEKGSALAAAEITIRFDKLSGYNKA